jgi:hypothetical protein
MLCKCLITRSPCWGIEEIDLQFIIPVTPYNPLYLEYFTESQTILTTTLGC